MYRETELKLVAWIHVSLSVLDRLYLSILIDFSYGKENGFA